MILLLGMPGAGKTTQTEMLSKYLNCPWFSMGQLIRDHASGQDRAEMLAGKIIGDEITLKILGDALASVDTAKDECVVEGNPRSIPQADWWLAKIKAGQVKLTGIVELTIDPVLAEQRMTSRGRLDDDDKKVVQKRLDEYNRSVVPTLKYLEEQGTAVHRVDGTGSVEEVADRIHKALGL